MSGCLNNAATKKSFLSISNNCLRVWAPSGLFLQQCYLGGNNLIEIHILDCLQGAHLMVVFDSLVQAVLGLCYWL